MAWRWGWAIPAVWTASGDSDDGWAACDASMAGGCHIGS